MQKIKLYIIGLTIACLGFGASLVIFTGSLRPDQTGNIVLFYILFAAFTFFFTSLAGYFLRKSWGQREKLHHYLSQASRQGLWFTLLLTLSLFLLSQGLFSWLSGGLLILTLVFLESYLLTKNERKS